MGKGKVKWEKGKRERKRGKREKQKKSTYLPMAGQLNNLRPQRNINQIQRNLNLNPGVQQQSNNPSSLFQSDGRGSNGPKLVRPRDKMRPSQQTVTVDSVLPLDGYERLIVDKDDGCVVDVGEEEDYKWRTEVGGAGRNHNQSPLYSRQRKWDKRKMNVSEAPIPHPSLLTPWPPSLYHHLRMSTAEQRRQEQFQCNVYIPPPTPDS